MLKTFRIIPLVFILFLFGFTLISVAPVLAEEQWNPSMGMCHNSRPCMKMNQCGDECAVHVRESKGWVNPNDTSQQNSGEVAQLNDRITELEAENARLLEQQGAPADQSGGEVDQLNAKIAKLEAENASRELQPCNYGRSICRLDVPQLRAKIIDLEGTIAWHCAAPRKNSACGR